MSARNHKHRSPTDASVETKRRIIRRSFDEITAEVRHELLCANICSSISIVVPARYSLVTIECLHDIPSNSWTRVSEIVRAIVSKRLGKTELRSRPLLAPWRSRWRMPPTRVPLDRSFGFCGSMKSEWTERPESIQTGGSRAAWVRCSRVPQPVPVSRARR